MSSQNRCVDCGDPVSARRRRCPPCRLDFRAQAARERRAAEAGLDYDGHADDAQDVIDYSGDMARPPSFDPGRQPVRRVAQEREVLPDGRVPSPAERQRQNQLDYSALPNSVRRDRALAHRLAAQQQSRAVNDEGAPLSWDMSLQDLQQRFDNAGHVVDVTRPGDRQGFRDRPVYTISDPIVAGQAYGDFMPDVSGAVLGRAVVRARPKPGPSSQQVPHIIQG